MDGESLTGIELASPGNQIVPEYTAPVEAVSDEMPSLEPVPQRVGRWRKFVAATALVAVAATTASCQEGTEHAHPDSHQSTTQQVVPSHTPTAKQSPTEKPTVKPQPADKSPKNRPNIIMVLTDDLDWQLVKPKLLPYITKLIRQKGATLGIEDEQSLCCTSRASILTGKYSHNTHVVGNTFPGGGYASFHRYDEAHALPVWLHKAGYYTAFMGKYFNEYPFPPDYPRAGVPDNYMPPGWDKFITPVGGNPYAQFDVRLADSGKVAPKMSHKFLGYILAHDAIRTLKKVPAHHPFFEEISTFSPHKPYAFPKKYAHDFTHLHYPHTPAFNEKNMHDKPMPLHNASPLTKAEVAHINEVYRDRVRAMQVVDHMVKRIMHVLAEKGELDNTYVVFTSDNGYFMGEHRRYIGKYDQYQTSLNVPLFVRGPGIAPGSDMRGVLASNIDLAPTYAQIAGVAPTSPVDGISLLNTWHGKPASADDRRYLLIARGDIPTYKHAASGLEEPPESGAETPHQAKVNDFNGVDYEGRYIYIRHTDKKLKPRPEFYDLQTDPYELNNLLGPDGEGFGRLSPRLQRIVRNMARELPLLASCAGTTQEDAPDPCNR